MPVDESQPENDLPLSLVHRHIHCQEDANRPCGWTVLLGPYMARCGFPTAHEVACSDKDDPEHAEYCEGVARLCCYHSEMQMQAVAQLN